MSRRTLAGLVSIAIALTGCTSEVVTGRAVPASSGRPTVQSGARFTDAATVAAVRNDVRVGVEAINSYDYRSLDAARNNGLRYTTGKLSSDYSTTFRTIIARNAPGLRASQQAQVNNVGVASVSATSASLLVFGQLTIRTKNQSGPRKEPFTVVAEARNVSGRWKLAKATADGSLTEDPSGTPALQQAVAGARSAATAATTFRRATFDADFARALSFLTGTLRGDVSKNRAATLKAMTDGGFDLRGVATATAVESASGTQAVVLLILNGYRIKNGVRQDSPTKQNLRLTVVSQGGRWLTTALESIGVR